MTDYDIGMEIIGQPLSLIDVPAIVDACDVPWWNRTLTQVDDSVVRLGIIEGEFHWHHHDEQDEFFFVLSGELPRAVAAPIRRRALLAGRRPPR